MKRFVLLLAGAISIIANSTSRSAPPTPEEGKALLLGTDTPEERILFRKLDNGPVLWTSPTSLGTTLSVAPGHHSLNVMCRFKSPGMTQLVPGNVEIDVKAGHVYDVVGSLEQGGRKCNVTVSSRSSRSASAGISLDEPTGAV